MVLNIRIFYLKTCESPIKKELRYTNYGNKDKRALRALVGVGLSLDPSVKKGTLVYRGCWHSVWR